MFDWEMIHDCAELYPTEFYGLCALMAIILPIGAFLMVRMAMIMMEE